MEIKDFMNCSFDLVDTQEGKTCCEVCVFNDTNACTLMTHNSSFNEDDEQDLLKLCQINNKMHWELHEPKVTTVVDDKIPVMRCGDSIILRGYEYRLEQVMPTECACAECIFGEANGKCCLNDVDNAYRNVAIHLIDNCKSIDYGVYKLKKGNTYYPNIDRRRKTREDVSHISSTGVENPSNDAPRVTKGDTKRHIDVVLTLDEARDWYNSHNPVLKDLACRAYTPAELEDVRRCTMNVDLKTAKRLYRNAENAVRDFVLSAFSKEELED